LYSSFGFTDDKGYWPVPPQSFMRRSGSWSPPPEAVSGA